MSNMKKLLLVPTIAIVLVSCGESESVADTELGRIEQDAERVEEEGVSSALDFNDGIMAEITLLDVKYIELSDYDAMDTTEEAIVAIAKGAVLEAEKVIVGIEKINVVGVNAIEFKTAALDLAISFKKVALGYEKIAYVFAIPDGDWTDDHYDDWDKYDTEFVEAYMDAGEVFNTLQLEYFNLNNLRSGNVVDPDAIYEESKNAEESIK